jgi:hypothetical protein
MRTALPRLRSQSHARPPLPTMQYTRCRGATRRDSSHLHVGRTRLVAGRRRREDAPKALGAVDGIWSAVSSGEYVKHPGGPAGWGGAGALCEVRCPQTPGMFAPRVRPAASTRALSAASRPVGGWAARDERAPVAVMSVGSAASRRAERHRGGEINLITASRTLFLSLIIHPQSSRTALCDVANQWTTRPSTAASSSTSSTSSTSRRRPRSAALLHPRLHIPRRTLYRHSRLPSSSSPASPSPTANSRSRMPSSRSRAPLAWWATGRGAVAVAVVARP